MTRLQDQGPVQRVGDVCLKLCSKLRAYTNFFNNYPTVLRTIDRVGSGGHRDRTAVTQLALRES